MRLYLLVGVVLALLLEGIVCPPVNQAKEKTEEKKEADDDKEDPADNVEYSRYLKEVVQALEEDPEFVKKLEQSNYTDIKSGDISQHIELVNHHVRTKLDEIKRREIQRLNDAVKAMDRKEHGGEHDGLDPQMSKLVAHLDHENPETFEEDDLRKLIQQATHDLETADDKRHKEFKEYEMTKEHMRREKLKHMDAAHRKAEEEAEKKAELLHKNHPKLHHPGSKQQLEEVWEDDDHMDKEDFNPKTFFALHDKDGNNLLDEAEVEALFNLELDKMYNENATEDDMVERDEEMNRMREHIFKEVDTNHDRFISLQEFLDSTKKSDFNKDEGWKGLDEEKPYTDEEFAKFERDYEEHDQQPHHEEPPHEGGAPQHHDTDLKFQPKVPPVPELVHPQDGGKKIHESDGHPETRMEHHNKMKVHHEMQAEKHEKKIEKYEKTGHHDKADQLRARVEFHKNKAEYHKKEVDDHFDHHYDKDKGGDFISSVKESVRYHVQKRLHHEGKEDLHDSKGKLIRRQKSKAAYHDRQAQISLNSLREAKEKVIDHHWDKAEHHEDKAEHHEQKAEEHEEKGNATGAEHHRKQADYHKAQHELHSKEYAKHNNEVHELEKLHYINKKFDNSRLNDDRPAHADPPHHGGGGDHHGNAGQHHGGGGDHHGGGGEHHGGGGEHHGGGGEHHAGGANHQMMQAHHEKLMDHHNAQADHHNNQAERHQESGNHELVRHHEALAEHHENKADHHENRMEHHADHVRL